MLGKKWGLRGEEQEAWKSEGHVPVVPSLIRGHWGGRGREARVLRTGVERPSLSGPRFAMRRCDPAITQEPGVSRSKSPASPTPSLSAEQAAGSPLLPLDSAGLSRGDVSRQEEAGTSGAGRADGPGPKPADAQAQQISEEPKPTPFVPFSGGGQRLGGPCGSARCLMSPSAKLPKSFSSPGGPSKPKKSRPPPEPEPVSGELGAGSSLQPHWTSAGQLGAAGSLGVFHLTEVTFWFGLS